MDWDLWRDTTIALGGLEMTGSDKDRFQAKVDFVERGSSWIAHSECSFNIGTLSPERMRKLQEQKVTVQLIEQGEAILEAGGHQMRAGPGDLVIRDWAETHSICSIAASDGAKVAKVLTLPRALLAHELEASPGSNSVVLRAELPGTRVARSFILSMEENLEMFGVDELDRYSVAAQELVLNALLLSRVSEFGAKGHGLLKVQGALEARIRDPGLKLHDVAKEVGLSQRSAQRLFQEIGTTSQRWIEQKRLNLVLKELTASSGRAASITDVAYRCGFGDFSTFNRAFKRSFGMTPTKYLASREAGSLPEETPGV